MARLRRAPVEAVKGVPPELADQLHPLWSDIDALAAHPVLGRYVTTEARQSFHAGRRLFHHVAGRWAVDQGLTTSRWGGVHVDWRALREAVHR